MTTTDAHPLLERVRKLLTKAEAVGVTPAEAQALTAKAAELMAKHGIDRALLAASEPAQDKPTDKIIPIGGTWARVQAHLLCGTAVAMRCQPVMLTGKSRVHVFGYTSDVERAEVMFTSLMLQMFRDLQHQYVPGTGGRARAWRRSYLLGWSSTAIERLKTAEAAAVSDAASAERSSETGQSLTLVLADRTSVTAANLAAVYPRTRKSHVSYNGTGFGRGAADGQRADIGQDRMGGPAQRRLTG